MKYSKIELTEKVTIQEIFKMIDSEKYPTETLMNMPINKLIDLAYNSQVS